MSEDELDQYARHVAKAIREADINDLELTLELLKQAEEVRLEFIKQNGLNNE
jgi:hypothetical protein